MNHVGQIPLTDEQAKRMVSPETLADLASQITATPPDPSVISWRRRRAPRRRMLLGTVVTAAVAGAGAGVVLSAGLFGKPLPPAAAKALTFTAKDGYITVIVKNPYADPSWYNADFAKHHLDVTLHTVPASPSLVGTVVFADEDPSGAGKQITAITAKGRCFTGNPGSDCQVGIKVPLDFRGQYQVVFGRPARPGEQYGSVTSAFAPGEALHGMHYIVGQPLAAVLAELRTRNLGAVLRTPDGSGPQSPGQSPGPWWVWGADPFAPGKVMLWVGHTGPSSSNPDPNDAS